MWQMCGPFRLAGTIPLFCLSCALSPVPNQTWRVKPIAVVHVDAHTDTYYDEVHYMGNTGSGPAVGVC